jgi:hypothetical protein
MLVIVERGGQRNGLTRVFFRFRNKKKRIIRAVADYLPSVYVNRNRSIPFLNAKQWSSPLRFGA